MQKKKQFFLNNSGNHWRDFTYINDVVEILYKLKNKNFKKIKFIIFVAIDQFI